MESVQKALERLQARQAGGGQPPKVFSTPPQRRYPPGYPPFHAIVDVLSRGETLHRSEIVARLSELGFPWDGRNPSRTIGTTLGRNRKIFEEVGRHRFRLRRGDPDGDGDLR